MRKLRNIIRESLKKYYFKEDKCGCGCNDCDTPPIIKESLNKKLTISEGLKNHIEKGKPLHKNIFKPGTKQYFDLFKEARSLHEQKLIQVNHIDRELLTQTKIGEFGIFEGNIVPLDFPLTENYLDFHVYVKNNKNQKISKLIFENKPTKNCSNDKNKSEYWVCNLNRYWE